MHHGPARKVRGEATLPAQRYSRVGPSVFDLGAEGGSGVGPRPFTARIFQAAPRVAHRGGTGCAGPRNDGEALWGALCLSCGTSPERIAPESLTRSLSDFVHGHISWRTNLLPPNRVTGLTRLPLRGLQLVNASVPRRKLVGWRSHPGAAQHRTAITASSRRPCLAASSRRIASPA